MGVRVVTRHSCIGKFKRRARRSTSYFRGMIYEVAENEHAYPISSWLARIYSSLRRIAIVSIPRRSFRARNESRRNNDNEEETDSRRESDEKGRKEVHETRDRKANESMAWKTWLYLAAPWKRRITLRGRVPLCLETTRPAYSWEYLLLRAGYEVTIAGTPSSWNRFYCRLVKRGIRPVLRRFYSNDVERRGWIGDLVDI